MVDQERVIEHQRGICLFGYPFFSERLLIPGYDPPRFMALIGNRVEGFKSMAIMFEVVNRSNVNAQNLQKMIPILLSESKQSHCHDSRNKKASREDVNWYVSMDHGVADVDDQGWIYSWSFKSRHWQGLTGFVRKRLWVRLPSTTPELVQLDDVTAEEYGDSKPHAKITREEALQEDEEALQEDEESLEGTEEQGGRWWDSSSDSDTLVSALQHCKLDRQRFDVIEQYFSKLSQDEQKVFWNEEMTHKVLAIFQFQTSRERFMKQWLQKGFEQT